MSNKDDFTTPKMPDDILADIATPLQTDECPSTEVTIPAVLVESESEDDKKLKADFETARDAIKSNIDQANDVVQELVNVAVQSQHPRAYEVLAQFLKTSSDMAKDLMSLHKQRKDIKKDDGKQDEQSKTLNQTNNTILVGTTADLNKFIEARKKGA